MDISKENLSINQLITEKKEIIFVEGDMIVPDSKPDILNTVYTSGVVCLYKKELQDGRIRLDGGINTYIMYLPDGTEEGVRGLNTVIDFSENVDIPSATSEMEASVNVNLKSMESKVINGRKVGIKGTLELTVKIFQKQDVEIVSDITDTDDIQMLKEDVNLNSLVGAGETKIYAKDTIQIDSIDLLAEILKVDINIVDRDVKVSYNKILTKAELNIQMMYLTEDNRIGQIEYKIPTVGFIDMPNVAEENICDVFYEIKNLIIKPNSQEEHSIYVEVEIEASCQVYEEKHIFLIQDLYSPTKELSMQKKQVMTISNKARRRDEKQIREKVNLKDIDGMELICADMRTSIIKEEKINTKILYEGDIEVNFIFRRENMQIEIREAKVPFEYVLEQLENGETLNVQMEMEIRNQDFIIQNGGDIQVNVDLNMDINMYRSANMNLIDSIEETGEREEQDYSFIIYIVKKGDTLWNIAKKFGSTVDDIARMNGIEDTNVILPNQKLYIPKFTKVILNSNV